MKKLPSEFPTTSAGFDSTKIAISFPEYLARFAHEEAQVLQLTVSGLLRRLLQWNMAKSPGRPAGSPPRVLPAKVRIGEPKVKMQMRVGVGDFAHLKKLAALACMSQSSVLAALLFRWLDLDPLARPEVNL